MLTPFDLAMRKQSRYEATYLPVVTAASAYTANDAVGGLITIGATPSNTSKGPPIEQDGLSLILQSLVLVDLDNQKKAMSLFLFNDTPSTPVDKTAYAPTAADLKKLIAIVPILAADYVTINSMAYVSYANLGRVIKPVGQKIYGALNTTGTPTWTNGLQLKLQFSHGL